VVTSILGDASFEVQKIILLLAEGKPVEPAAGQIRYIPLAQTFPESLTREMDALLLALQIGEVKTNVTSP